MHNKKYDYLIIGSGIAGMTAALEANEKGYQVALVTKSTLQTSNTSYAQGGICCVVDNSDSFKAHIKDTLIAGDQLCNKKIVKQIIKQAPPKVDKLIQYGVEFTRKNTGDYSLGKEGGHSHRRILHAEDLTGIEIIRVLAKKCSEEKKIHIFENHIAIDLLTLRRLGWDYKQDQCLGAYILNTQDNQVYTFEAQHTILATGGAGKVYRYTTNPSIATGDGIAMGYRAFAKIINMEFFQFHPTCFFHRDDNSFLISEAVRGEGAKLKVKKKGKFVTFMEKFHPLAELAPRDIVARAIDQTLKESGQECVYLDITHKKENFLRERFPNIFNHLLKYKINMATDLIPVVPAAHYCCGGIETNLKGQIENINNLYAIGEVACTGFHGANRLASNGLLEGLIMAHNCIDYSSSLSKTKANASHIPKWSSKEVTDSDELVVITHNWAEIRSFMWDYVGIFRTNKRLQRSKRRIRNIQHEIQHYYWNFKISADLIELRNLACTAEIIIDSALKRRESRGLHYNHDFPIKNKKKSTTIIQKQ